MADLNPEDFGAVKISAVPAESKPDKAPKIDAPKPEDFGAVPVAAKGALGSPELVKRMGGNLARKAVDKVASTAKQMDADVDYSGVTAAGLRAEYGFLDTPEEKQKFLKSHFGKDNVTTDSYGRDVVTMNGQKVAFLPRGEKDVGKEGSVLSSWADVASDIAPVGGMVLGSLATSPIPGAPIVGAGFGGAAGKGINKLIKEVMGANKQTPSQIADDIAWEVPKGMAAQAGGELIGLAGRSLVRGPYREGSIFGPITDKTKATFAKVQEEVAAARELGLKPKVGTYSPNAAFTQRVQNAGFRLFGDELPSKNRPILEREAAKFTGGPMQNSPESTEALNQSISARTDQIVKTADAVANHAQALAESELRAAEDLITGKVGKADGNLGQAVANDIRKAREQFSIRASEMYAPVDAISGKPVVPTDGLKQVMKTILEEGPQTTKGNAAFASDTIKKFAADIAQLPEHVTFQQMQVARSTLRDSSALEALNAGLSDRQAARLAKAADNSFNDAINVVQRQPMSAEAAAKAMPDSITTAVARLGGIKQSGSGGEFVDMNKLPTWARKGNHNIDLVHDGAGAKSADHMRELMEEKGYLPKGSSEDDLTKMINNEVRVGKPSYFSNNDWERVSDIQARATQKNQVGKESVNSEAALKALRRADKFYAAGMKRFNDLTVQAMVRDATQAGFVEPEKVAARLAVPGQNEKLLRVQKSVTPETFGKIGAAKWSQILEDSKDALTGNVSGKSLATKLKKMGQPMLETLYGARTAGEMAKYADLLAGLNGQIDASTLVGGNLTEVIKSAVLKKEALNATMERGWVKALQSDGPQSLDAAQWLTEPGHRLALRQAIDAFGPQSQEARNLKEYLARRIFSSMEIAATKGAERYSETELMGKPLQDALNVYDRAYLEEVFGKQWTDSAYKFAKIAETAGRKNPQDSGQLIAASIGIHPIKNIAQVARFFLGGEALSTEPVITYLSRGIESRGLDVLQNGLGKAVQVGMAYEAEEVPKKTADQARGWAIHTGRSPFGQMLQSTGARQ